MVCQNFGHLEHRDGRREEAYSLEFGTFRLPSGGNDGEDVSMGDISLPDFTLVPAKLTAEKKIQDDYVSKTLVPLACVRAAELATEANRRASAAASKKAAFKKEVNASKVVAPTTMELTKAAEKAVKKALQKKAKDKKKGTRNGVKKSKPKAESKKVKIFSEYLDDKVGALTVNDSSDEE